MHLLTRLFGFVFLSAALATGCGGGTGKECGSDSCGTGELCCTVSCPGGEGTPMCYSGTSCPVATCDAGIADMTPHD